MSSSSATSCSYQDERLQAEEFDQAFAIVANNDARYQINKDRSLHFTCEAGVRLRWSVAQDIADAQALQAEDCDKDTKIRWLQYHDRDTGDRCGMLPLALGMHVALTDHIDRSDKLLLRGRVGQVHSFQWPETAMQPEVVFQSANNVLIIL